MSHRLDERRWQRTAMSVMVMMMVQHATVALVAAATAFDFEGARVSVDRFPRLTINDNPLRVANDILIPQLNAPLTYGPFAAETNLPSDCFLFSRGVGSTPDATESEYPYAYNAWPSSVNKTASVKWYGFLCVTDTSILAKADGTSRSFLRDILPVLRTGKTTRAQRVAWGMRGFAYFLCRGIDDAWLTHGTGSAQKVTTYDAAGARSSTIVGNPTYSCVESYMGYFHQGLPMPPNYPDPVTYVVPNPSIEYYCVNHTTFFGQGNNPTTDTLSVDYQAVGVYTKYTLDCYAKDGFAETYNLDSNGNAVSGTTGLPTTLACGDTSATGSVLKMVETCSLAYISNITVSATYTGYECEVQCRYPCITQSAYMTYQSQTASSLCRPTARIAQCNRAVSDISAQFCDSTETMSAFQTAPNAGLNTFENDIVSECTVGSLGCRIQCHCKGEQGCPNHVKCNYHGTLFDTSIVSTPPLTPTCMCEPGRTGDTCETAVSNVVCNRGQEL